MNTYPYARPGGVYKLIINFGMEVPNTTATVKLGLETGTLDKMTELNVISGVPVYLTLPFDAKSAFPLIQVTGAAIIVTNITYQFVPTFYRVYKKTVSSGDGKNYPYNYSYINPATAIDSAAVNDAEHSSDACPHSAPQDRNTNPANICTAVVETYSEYRGNGMVTVTGPDGAQTITTFAQDDARKGQADKVTRKSANGNKLQETINTATAINLGISGSKHDYHSIFIVCCFNPTSTET